MLIVHHLGISQSDRIVWLCEELGVPYELKRYDRDATTRLAPADYKALTPFGTAPVIDDGDLRLAESGAIVEYVAHTHAGGRLFPKPGSAGYADFLFWWHFANGSLMPSAMTDMVAGMVGEDGVLANDAAAAIDEKQRKEEHWRRAGALRVEEDDAPLGARDPGTGERRPRSPLG